MLDNYKNILKRICRLERCYVYISKLERKQAFNGKVYTLVYMSNLNNETIMCIYNPGDRYDEYYEDYKKKIRLPFYAITINLEHESYYRIDWEDVNLHKYDIKHLHEIARIKDENDNEIPIRIKQYVIYEYYEQNVTIEQFLTKAVKEDDEYINDILSDINRYELEHFFNPSEEYTNRLLEYRNDFTPRRPNTPEYDYYDNLNYDNDDRKSYIDMTEEERVMDALENGNGEYYGY